VKVRKKGEDFVRKCVLFPFFVHDDADANGRYFHRHTRCVSLSVFLSLVFLFFFLRSLFLLYLFSFFFFKGQFGCVFRAREKSKPSACDVALKCINSTTSVFRLKNELAFLRRFG